MVLPEGTPQSITREFSTLLLDALREIDEGASSNAEWSLDDFQEAAPAAARTLAPLEHLRELDGCTAACLVDTESGVVLGAEGNSEIDLQAAAAGYAEIYRTQVATLAALELDDHLEDVQVTLASQYHILRSIAVRPSLCIYVIIDRGAGNLGMARFALAAAEAAFDA
jgi:hypothetical protein